MRTTLLGQFQGCLLGLAVGDAVGAPFMLDVKFTYHLPWVKGLSVCFGRFLSTYSLIMSRLISCFPMR